MSVDLKVHRLRDLNYLPGAVVSLASSSSHLAVARDNGRVELHNDRLQPTYSLQCPAPVTSMIHYDIQEDEENHVKFIGALCQMGSFGLIDFTNNCWSHHTASGGGEIFDICILKGTQCVAVACQDGCVRVFSLLVNSEKVNSAFELVQTLPSATAAIQSLACHRVSGKDDLDGLELYAGVVDGTIRKYQITPGGGWRCTHRMTVECRGRSVPTQIWSMDVTTDGTLVSGDSLGQVQFWRDGVWLGSLEQNDNQADVLAVIAVGEAQVFASGVDARVVCLRRDSGHQWVVSQAQRPHTHDVMDMALICHQKTLVTAGVDSKLCSYEISKWGRMRPIVTYPWPSRSPVSVGGRRLAMKRQEQVDMYQLNEAKDDLTYPQVQLGEKQIGSILVGQPVEHVCLSPNAEFLSVQTVYLRLFRIGVSKQGAFQPRELATSHDPLQDIVAMRFVDNRTLVVATASRKLIVLSMPEGDEKGQAVSILCSATQEETTALPIHSMTSFRAEWFATLASEGNQHRAVAVYRIVADEIVHYWTLPDVGSKITAFAFLSDGTLAVACERFSFYLFDVANRCLTTWSESAGIPMEMPSEIASRRDFPVSIGVNPATPNVLFLVSCLTYPRGLYCDLFASII